MQSILRLRQHSNTHKIAVLFTAEPLTGLPQVPIPFELDDTLKYLQENQGRWENYKDFLKAPPPVSEASEETLEN